MPKGNQKPTPIVARPLADMRDDMAKLCDEYGKSHTQLLCDLWRLHRNELAAAWAKERSIFEDD